MKQFLKFITLESFMECSKCHETLGFDPVDDKFDAAREYENDGWKIINGKPICPDCIDEVTYE